MLKIEVFLWVTVNCFDEIYLSAGNYFREKFQVGAQFSVGGGGEGAIFLGGNCPGGGIVRGAIIRRAIYLAGNCPRTSFFRQTLGLGQTSGRLRLTIKQNLKLQTVDAVIFSILIFQKREYNHFHNILRLFDVLPNFPFNTSKTMHDYCL